MSLPRHPKVALNHLSKHLEAGNYMLVFEKNAVSRCGLLKKLSKTEGTYSEVGFERDIKAKANGDSHPLLNLGNPVFLYFMHEKFENNHMLHPGTNRSRNHRKKMAELMKIMNKSLYIVEENDEDKSDGKRHGKRSKGKKGDKKLKVDKSKDKNSLKKKRSKSKKKNDKTMVDALEEEDGVTTEKKERNVVMRPRKKDLSENQAGSSKADAGERSAVMAN